MDYYESSRPPTDDSGLSGGVTFNFNGQIATQSFTGGGGGGGGGDSGSSRNNDTIVTLDICVNGTPKKLDVYAVSDPYDP